MADSKKITKVEYFENIKAIVAGCGEENAEELVAFVQTQIDQLQAKAAKAKERAAEKRAEGDALREVVASAVTDEWQSGAQIAEQIDGEDVTKAKVIARLTQLVKAGVIVKEEMKLEGAEKKCMCYKLADAE